MLSLYLFMSAQKGARSKLADVLADIKNSRVEDEYDYNNHDIAPTPAKRRSAVNYVALSGHTPRQSRSNAFNTSSSNQSNNTEPKTNPSSQTSPTLPSTRSRTYILKLFNRTVDLAQFINEDSREDPPLYPVCRAWVHGHRAGQIQKPFRNLEKQTDRTDRTNGSPNVTQQELSNEPAPEVYNLPPAKPKSEMIKQFNLAPEGEDIDIRIPESVRNFKVPENIGDIIDKSIESMNHNDCMELNKQRWKKVKKEWSEARNIHESRYEDSFKVLHEMFMS